MKSGYEVSKHEVVHEIAIEITDEIVDEIAIETTQSKLT